MPNGKVNISVANLANEIKDSMNCNVNNDKWEESR